MPDHVESVHQEVGTGYVPLVERQDGPLTLAEVEDMWIPSVDVCAICGAVYCDGIACVADLDPNDEADQPRLEQLQDWVRAGRAWEKANAFLAYAEGRGHQLPHARRIPIPMASTSTGSVVDRPHAEGCVGGSGHPELCRVRGGRVPGVPAEVCEVWSSVRRPHADGPLDQPVLNAEGVEIASAVVRPATRVVQLSRAKGSKREPGVVVVDRSTPWGNPFFRLPERDTMAEVVADFEEWVASGDPKAVWIREHVHELAGETLGCWCDQDGPCHAKVLARMADFEVCVRDLAAIGYPIDEARRAAEAVLDAFDGEEVPGG